MLVRMKLNHAITPLDNPQKIKQAKLTIARLLTELRYRELNGNQKS
jgi:large subunit ribosomal protein L29